MVLENEPLSNEHAQKLIREILKYGTVFFTSHAQKALADDRMSTPDVENILRAGWVECRNTRTANGAIAFERRSCAPSLLSNQRQS
jgi:hypothetical protein